MLHPLWGHETERRMLARARREGTFPSSLLFHGARGVGKQRLALWTAQLLLCEAPAEDPCGACHACRLVLRLQHPDLHWHFPMVRPKGATGDRLGPALEDARAERLAADRAKPIRFIHLVEPNGIYLAAMQGLRRRAQSRPSEGENQIFVVGDAEAMVSQEASPEAANALLKLLEEPPPGTRMILTSSEPGRLLPTIRSRTVPIHVGRLPREMVSRFLVEQAGFDAPAAARVAAMADGSVGRALGFLPGEDGTTPLEDLRIKALDLVRAALSSKPSEAFRVALSFSPTGGRSLVDLLDFLDQAIRDVAALAAGAPERAVNPEIASALERGKVASLPHPTDAARCLAVVERCRELARGNVNPQLLVAGLIGEMRRCLSGQSTAAVGIIPQ